MNFWHRLRWLAAIAFIALVVLRGLGSDASAPAGSNTPRPVPTINR